MVYIIYSRYCAEMILKQIDLIPYMGFGQWRSRRLRQADIICTLLDHVILFSLGELGLFNLFRIPGLFFVHKFRMLA